MSSAGNQRVHHFEPFQQNVEMNCARQGIKLQICLDSSAQMLHIFASLSSKKKKKNRDGKNAYDAERQRREDREGGMRHIIVL